MYYFPHAVPRNSDISVGIYPKEKEKRKEKKKEIKQLLQFTIRIKPYKSI